MILFPSIQGKLGSWTFYSTKMTARDLASQVKFASEVWQAKALDHWIQRALNTARAKKEIARYLAQHEDHFFNSIVIAALDGSPKFFPVQFTDDPQFAILADDRMNAAFGVLRFDGTQAYYALDGQHRLKAIKALIDEETEFQPSLGFGDDEFSVLLVVPSQNESREEFMQKYRRLFSHLNRYAKPMDKATTIIMEEDDLFAVCTRRLIQEHKFFSWFEDEETARVRCKGSPNMGSADGGFFTNIITLYEMNTRLLSSRSRKNTEWNDPRSVIQNRPDDDTIDMLYTELVTYWDALLEILPDLHKEPRIMRTSLSEDDNSGDEVASNHFLFRPIGQLLLAELVRDLLDKADQERGEQPTKDSVISTIRRIAEIDWRLFKSPWVHLVFVYESDGDHERWRMRSEDRKDAVRVAKNIMHWILGVIPYSSEEDVDDGIKKKWKSMLWNVDEERAEALWQDIKSLAAEMRIA